MVRFATVRILLDYRPALRERTGVGEFAHQLARALARLGAGDEVAILTTSWKDRPPPEVNTELAGVRVIDRRVPVRGLTWTWTRLGWPPVEWLAGPADVVHAQTPLVIPTTRAAQVITIHDLDFLLRPERAEREMRRDFPARVARHAARADHIIVSSRYAAGEVATRLGVTSDRITVCSPGVPSWAAVVAEARTSVGTDPPQRLPSMVGTAKDLALPRTQATPDATPWRTPFILFLGTLEPRKNIHGLLDGYATLRATRPDAPPLVLAGRARASMSEELGRTRIAPLAGHVQHLGYVSDEQKQQLYRDACMLVLASFEEGFGLPVLEAMACGVPVVVANRGSLPEVAGPAAAAVDPDDPRALAAAMERLLDRDEARAATTRGLTQAQRYSWEACARAARQAYQAAITSRARRRA